MKCRLLCSSRSGAPCIHLCYLQFVSCPSPMTLGLSEFLLLMSMKVTRMAVTPGAPVLCLHIVGSGGAVSCLYIRCRMPLARRLPSGYV
ncbi:hypothetical protein GDO81_028832 [Engystomops pustulosus]|uniref:Secreted protein n=1 Tax=Engystomops pustulosus TaxID=76066 RepID=A0AAV6YDN7_ENGPU|nr:hypothetical protein GDO81_028832 [Engystomops pustulosus]